MRAEIDFLGKNIYKIMYKQLYTYKQNTKMGT